MAKGAMAAGKTARQAVKAAGGTRQDARTAAQTARQDYRANLNALSPRAQDVFAPALAQSAKVSQLQNRLGRVQDRIGTVQSKMALPNANVDRLMPKLDRLSRRSDMLSKKLDMRGAPPAAPGILGVGALAGALPQAAVNALPGQNAQLQPVGMLPPGAAPMVQGMSGLSPAELMRLLGIA